MAKPPYFSRLDWQGFWITTLGAFAVYLLTLAPNVTLEDSGEFLTAAYHWGVPHPPGYPAWTLSANLFERLIPFGNAAWRGNMMSAFYGALSAGMLCLIACKLAARLWQLERLKNFSIPGITRERLSLMAGVVAGLIFAFIDTMWSQAVIAEVYTLNSFFFTLLGLLVLRWFDAPGQWRWSCLVALSFGLGITNHQTLIVSAPAFLFVMFCVDRVLCRDTSLLGAIASAIFAWQSGLWFLWAFAAGLLLLFVVLLLIDPQALNIRNFLTVTFSLFLGGLGVAIFAEKDQRPVWLFLGGVMLASWLALVVYDVVAQGKALKSAAPFILSFVMFTLGFSVYLYMPLSSHTNPPMNWGYTKTLDGFRHHFTRGQYERIQTKRDPRVLLGQYNQFFHDMQDNFSLPLALLGVLPLIFLTEYPKREKEYMGFTVLCFVCMGFVLVYLMNSKFDEQSAFINRVFYSLAHGVYSLWIGLGSIFLLYWGQHMREKVFFIAFALAMGILSFVGWRWGQPWWVQAVWLGGSAVFFLCLAGLLKRPSGSYPAVGLIYALPVIPLLMNWSASEMRGHDFGWRYGHEMLKDLDRDAVVYGGTDPGRFVPTYMIFTESFQPDRWKKDPEFDRRDLYIITQNALADQTYMNYIRDHYDGSRPKMDRWYHKLLGRDELYPKEPLRLPNDQEFNQIFSEVIQANKDNPRSGVSFQKDATGNPVRASVQGVEGVFAINGGIAQWIFEQNKAKHTFYVEESYPIQWMYPYLEPAGLIMKLNKEPLSALDPKVVAKDMSYWAEIGRDLLSNPAFLRDSVAQKSYSKLRSSIGGLYSFRGMFPEAEIALKQALDFYPASAEARSRLTEIYMMQNRYDEALKNCEGWLKLDPYNPAPAEVLSRVHQYRNMVDKEKEMNSLYEYNKKDPNFIFQYVNVLRERNKWPEVDKILDDFLNPQNKDTGAWQTAVQFYGQFNRVDRMEALLDRWSKLDAKNPLIWLNLAMVQSAMFKGDQACANLKKAIKLDTNLVQTARADARFNNIRAMEQFQKLVP